MTGHSSKRNKKSHSGKRNNHRVTSSTLSASPEVGDPPLGEDKQEVEARQKLGGNGAKPPRGEQKPVGDWEKEEVERIQRVIEKESSPDTDLYPFGITKEETGTSSGPPSPGEQENEQFEGTNGEESAKEGEEVVERLLRNLGEFSSTVGQLNRISARLKKEAISMRNFNHSNGIYSSPGRSLSSSPSSPGRDHHRKQYREHHMQDPNATYIHQTYLSKLLHHKNRNQFGSQSSDLYPTRFSHLRYDIHDRLQKLNTSSGARKNNTFSSGNSIGSGSDRKSETHRSTSHSYTTVYKDRTSSQNSPVSKEIYTRPSFHKLVYPPYRSAGFQYGQDYAYLRDRYDKVEHNLEALERQLSDIAASNNDHSHTSYFDSKFASVHSKLAKKKKYFKENEHINSSPNTFFVKDLVQATLTNTDSYPESLNNLDELDRTYYERKLRSLERALDASRRKDQESLNSLSKAMKHIESLTFDDLTVSSKL
eukprot:Nk52_evm4s298 gene=Nk52_evmTU4s298